MQLQGIIPPIVTPHLADGAIDEDGFRTVADHLIETGVHALIV